MGNQLVCRTSTVMSSVIGNLTTIFTEHFKEYFPKNYFKNTFMLTSLLSSEYASDDVHKDSVPILSIDVDYDTDTILGLLPQWYNTQLSILKDAKSNYEPVFYNDEDDIYIVSIPDRIKVNFDIKIRVNGKMQAMDLRNFIKQRIETNGYYYLNDIELQNELPKALIKAIARVKDFNLNTPEGNNELHEYLKMHSDGLITRNISLASGNPVYSYKSKYNLLIKTNDVPSVNYEAKAKEQGKSLVELQLACESWFPANFILESKIDPYTLNSYMEEDVYDDLIHSDSETTSLNLSTIKRKAPIVFENKSLFLEQRFLTEANVPVDILDISVVTDSDIKDFIKYNIYNAYDNEDFFTFALYYNENELVYKKDFTFDFNTLEVKINKPYYNVQYDIHAYVDRLAMLDFMNQKEMQ